MCVKRCKNHDRLRSDKCKVTCFEAMVVFCCQSAAILGISFIILAMFTHCSQDMLWGLLGMWGLGWHMSEVLVPLSYPFCGLAGQARTCVQFVAKLKRILVMCTLHMFSFLGGACSKVHKTL